MAELETKEKPEKADEKTPILPTYFKADMAENSSTSIRYMPKLEEKNKKRVCTCCCVLAIAAISAGIALVVGLAVGLSRGPVSLPESIESGQLVQLLKDLQLTSIDNSRSVLNGYNDSADYVIKTLQDNGYDTTTQFFTVPVFENLRPGEAVFEATISNVEYKFVEFNVMTYSGSCTDCSSSLEIVEEEHNYGCDSNLPDFENKIVLMPYNDTKGGCSLYQKAYNALQHNAAAVIFARDNEDTNGPPASRIIEKNSNGEFDTVNISAIGVTGFVGNLLRSSGSGSEVKIETITSIIRAITYNVFARTKDGSNESVIVVGSHLDSVAAGPGINDNGSGSMANLQLAIEIEKLGIKPKNQVMFAWWGAEELGLLGSTYFVAQLTEEEKAAIALNINMDMIASPNYIRGIYNGTSANESIVNASTTIQNALIEYFENADLQYEIVPFTGRSDYGPFIEVGIPAGGLFTGAELRKTQEQFEKFGGLLNAPLDPCYHQACDTTDNINTDVFGDMTKAAAHAIQTLMEKENLNEFLENGMDN